MKIDLESRNWNTCRKHREERENMFTYLPARGGSYERQRLEKCLDRLGYWGHKTIMPIKTSLDTV